ncbi:MAG: alpha-glucosidase [Myxococcota bacterium]|jgi:alpha-glucosidase
MMSASLWALLGLGCGKQGEVVLGDFEVLFDERDGAITIDYAGRTVLDAVIFELGEGSADITFQAGSYLFEDVEADWSRVAALDVRSGRSDGPFVADLLREDGRVLGALEISTSGSQILSIRMIGQGGFNRARLSAGCAPDDHFLGGGAHAMDVDHAGEAFPLFVSEPGIGKSETDEPTDSWFLVGTRHASSYPDPFFVQTGPRVGMQVNTDSRVDADLCTDGQRWSLAAWEDSLWLSVLPGDDVLSIVELRTRANGGVVLPPDWAFAPWNDAVMGEDRVQEVVRTLREAGAPSSVIWTEDWKGGEDNGFGYHLLPEWDADTTLYPDIAGLDAELEAQGFKWLAYFSPFISPEASTWEESAEHTISDPETGEPYLFITGTLHEASSLDLTDGDAWDWAQEKMTAAADLGFDGWMVDFAEWLPPEAIIASGDALDDHNSWPVRWQALNAEVLAGRDATFFARSGWLGTPATAPIIWAGDQRTDFQTDDGLPTVLAMGLGMSVSGVPFFAHDIAGYSSLGNPASDKELWLRWCSLGAFSPIMRTHHGAYIEDNWQFDSDGETLAHFARYATVHTALFPYLRGLAAQAEVRGTPLLLHPAMLYEDADWAAIDAWMLGPSLLVAPVIEQGATSREVALPGDVEWHDWWTGEAVSAGVFEAQVGEIPVFAPRGAIIPMFTFVPDTLASATAEGVTDLEDADGSRTITVFGGGVSRFVEADGTEYATTGLATAANAETATATLVSGEIAVGGVTLTVSGAVERDYTVVVYP